MPKSEQEVTTGNGVSLMLNCSGRGNTVDEILSAAHPYNKLGMTNDN